MALFVLNMKKIEFKKYIPHLIILLASILISIPIFKMNLSSTNEFRIHIGRIVAISKLIKNNIFPALISNNNMNGFGYALNIFYGPITTYLPMLLSYKSIASTGIQIFTLISIIASGYAMYFYTLKITKNKIAATCSALMYILLPYKLTNIYSRNALGEYSASIFLPLLLNGLYELTEGNSKKTYLIALSAIGLILSHTITTIYASIFSIIYLIAFYKKLNLHKIKILIINVIIAILVTSFYWIPLMEYRANTKYAIFDSKIMNTTGSDVYENTSDFDSLFENEINYKDNDGNSYPTLALGIMSVTLLLFSIICYNKVEKNLKMIYILFIIFTAISLWMTTKLFPWQIMPNFMTVIQFAWRMLGFYILFGSVICGINASILYQNKKYNGDILIFIIILFQLIISCLYVKNYYNSNYKLDSEYNYQKTISQKRISPMSINREYLPVKAFYNLEYINNRTQQPIIINGDASINNFEKNQETGKSTFKISIITTSEIELPYIYYPSYKITDENNKDIDFTESENGFIQIKLNKSTNITVEPKMTKIEELSYIISIVGIIILIINIIISKREERKQTCQNQ